MFSSRFKELKCSNKYIYHHHHLHLNISKIEIFCLLMFGGIVVKMDKIYLFEEVLKVLFHT
jgi:hypothetical protein